MKKYAVILLSAFAISATTPGLKGDNTNSSSTVNSSRMAVGMEGLQCGVSHAQIEAYLEGAPHYHTVFAIRDIAGTCNSEADIENCGKATVYVQNGRIVGHIDQTGYCPQ